MNITVSLAAFVLGALSIIVGIVGGGLTIKDASIPQLSMTSRVLACIFGGMLLLAPYFGPKFVASLQTAQNAPATTNGTPLAATEPKPDEISVVFKDTLSVKQVYEHYSVMIDGKYVGELVWRTG